MASPISMIRNTKTRAFAEACFNDNSRRELAEILNREIVETDYVIKYDIKQFGITAQQWQEGIKAAIAEMDSMM